MSDELTHWTGPHGLPDFRQIKDDDFAAAFDAALAQALAQVEKIAANPDPAGFDNTLVALEGAEQDLDRVAAIFFTLASVDSNPARQKLQRDLAPKLASFHSQISMDRRLLDRVSAVWDQRDTLDPQDRRLTELTLRGLRRSGAGLDGAARARMAALRERLAVLYTQFSQNVQDDERDFFLPVPADRTSGLPDWLMGAMAAAARERDQSGLIVTSTDR